MYYFTKNAFFGGYRSGTKSYLDVNPICKQKNLKKLLNVGGGGVVDIYHPAIFKNKTY